MDSWMRPTSYCLIGFVLVYCQITTSAARTVTDCRWIFDSYKDRTNDMLDTKRLYDIFRYYRYVHLYGADVRKMIQSIDKDGDEQINVAQFCSLMKQEIPAKKNSELATRKFQSKTHLLFLALDTDGNDFLSYDEYRYKYYDKFYLSSEREDEMLRSEFNEIATWHKNGVDKMIDFDDYLDWVQLESLRDEREGIM